jgi:hypothetical protein
MIKTGAASVARARVVIAGYADLAAGLPAASIVLPQEPQILPRPLRGRHVWRRMPYMDAELLWEERVVMPDGAIVEIMIWRLPKVTADRPHRVKYRLYYGAPDGRCLVRYDNEAGKGDHRHVRKREFSHEFISVKKLLQDFWADVMRIGGYDEG